MGSLVVLLLAERARSEGARSTRALEDQPGYPVKEVGVERTRAVGGHLARPVWLVSLVPPVSHVPRQRNYARSGGRLRPLL